MELGRKKFRPSDCKKTFFESKTAQKRKEKFWSSFFKSLQDSKGRSPWPLPAGSGIYPFAPRARTKRKKRVRRPAADDPAPSFCLQNDGLEFPSFYPQLICVSKQHLFVQFARPYSLFRQAVGRKKFRPFLHWIGTVHLPLNRTDEQSARMKKQQ